MADPGLPQFQTKIREAMNEKEKGSPALAPLKVSGCHPNLKSYGAAGKAIIFAISRGRGVWIRARDSKTF